MTLNKLIKRPDILKLIESAAETSNLRYEPEKIGFLILNTVQQRESLRKCDAVSVVYSFTNALAAGFYPHELDKLFYIISYGGRAVFQISYKGLIQLMYRHCNAKQVISELIYEADDFDLNFNYNTGRFPHKKAKINQRGNIVGTYAIVEIFDDGIRWCYVETVDAEEIQAHINYVRGLKQNKGQLPRVWQTHFKQMLRKLALTRVWTYLPKQIEITLDDTSAYDHEEVQVVSTQHEQSKPTPEQQIASLEDELMSRKEKQNVEGMADDPSPNTLKCSDGGNSEEQEQSKQEPDEPV